MGYFNTLYKLSHWNVGSKAFPELSSVVLARPTTSEPWSFPSQTCQTEEDFMLDWHPEQASYYY